MKKYWKVLVLCVLIVITIGTYYIQGAIASKNALAMKIETVNGNEDEIENIVVQARHDRNHVYRELYISKDGSENAEGNSIIKSSISPIVPLQLAEQVQEYRNFMRGKNLYPNNYFEDDTRLIYVEDINDDKMVWESKPLTFGVDILDKKTKERTTFEVQTPSVVHYNWSNIQNIYVADGKIKILTTLHSQMGAQELHVYVIDEQKQVLSHETLLAKLDRAENYSTDIRLYNNEQTLANKHYYLYDLQKIHHYEEQAMSTDMYVYNAGTSELETWEAPTELVGSMDYAMIQGEELYIPKYSTNGFELHQYNFETKQWAEPLTVTYPAKVVQDSHRILQILDNKLYSVSRMDDRYMLLIHDLQTGEALFEGKMTNEEQLQESELYIEGIYKVE